MLNLFYGINVLGYLFANSKFRIRWSSSSKGLKELKVVGYNLYFNCPGAQNDLIQMFSNHLTFKYQKKALTVSLF